MISAQEIERAVKASEGFRQAITAARYLRDTDCVELTTPWGVLIIDRAQIHELCKLSANDLEGLSVSATGLHVEAADVDINSAGLITDIARRLETEAAHSF
jgi:hypothetical protein